MPRRPLLIIAIVAALCLVGGGIVYAQMEAGERGIMPLDSSGTLEIDGIHVDVGGKDAQSSRLAGWRIAQREGFRMLWAKSHARPPSEAPRGRARQAVGLPCAWHGGYSRGGG